ncbi:MAG: circularly permuted type 2 ATP-grasp protein, partial [Candidatus Gastranaerophilaceae bacterium]
MKYDIAMKYKPQANIYDELFLADGMPRKVTETILSNLREIGDEEAERRRRRLNYTRYYQAIIKTQNEDEHGLDSIPLFLTSDEFDIIKKGLTQRAKLYDLIAKDLYGEQNLIKDGIVPPALVYANPDFLQMLWTGKNSKNNFGCCKKKRAFKA